MSIRTLFQWLDSDYSSRPMGSNLKLNSSSADSLPQYELDRFFPFIFLHAGCLALPLVGWSPTAVATAFLLYFLRMFAITGFYHRYFSHRSFKSPRPVQFIFAVIGNSAVQRGPLWWAAHHRHHHKYSDRENDVHSPRRSFFWSHIGWITVSANMQTRYELIEDFKKFPELLFLNRFDWVVPLFLFITLYIGGELLSHYFPQLNCNGPQLLVWGFFISTTVLFHCTSAINSFAHIFGSRRYSTDDDSKNNALLALLTLGEGWHNNHHKFSSCTRQGFFWWEIDITYYLLFLMSRVGLVSELKPVPQAAYRNEQQLLPSGSPVKDEPVMR